MGIPIKAGDSYSNYDELRSAAIKNAYTYSNNAEVSSTQNYTKSFSISLNIRNIAAGSQHGKNATVQVDWLNNTTSIYSTEYKPKNFEQDKYNSKFTTIYDYGMNDNTGKLYFLKAEDINGNNIVDENEITYFNNEEEMWDSQK